MTLDEFVASITINPNDAGETALLPVREDAWPAAEEDALAPGSRYAVIQRVLATDALVLPNGGSIEATTTSVRIYQKPNPDDPKPARAALRAIYRVLHQAISKVTESPLGPFVGLTLTTPRVPIQSDPDKAPGPEGLVGIVTFQETAIP